MQDNTINTENIIRLLKPRRKNLLSLVFSRFFIFVLLMLVQVAIFVFLEYYAREHIEGYMVVRSIFAFVMIVYLFTCSMDNSAKLTWMLIMAALPVPGAILLFFTNQIGRASCRERV